MFGLTLILLFLAANGVLSILAFLWLRRMLFDWRLQWPRTSEFVAIVLLIIQALVVLIFITVTWYNKPMKLKTEQIYGIYRVDKSRFDKKQAAWQYENFEIEIGRDQILRLYQLQPYREILDSAEFTFSQYSNAPHISLKIDSTKHHILSTNPTLYRKPFSFYYVFESDKFGNMFFEKTCY